MGTGLITYATDFSNSRALKLLCIGCGFVPVSAIALHVLNLNSLSSNFLFLVVPSALILFIAAMRCDELKKCIVKGWTSGLLAVFLYDLSRVPFMLAGWTDFIPHIGDWLFDEQHVNPIIGYAWRYIGNGGGMGISFFLLMYFFPNLTLRWPAGILYGFLIFLSLMLTILITPTDGQHMFTLNALTVSGSLLGHLIYGFVLGRCFDSASKISSTEKF